MAEEEMAFKQRWVLRENIVPLVFVIAFLLMGGIGGWYLLLGGKDMLLGSQAKSPAKAALVYLPMDEFVVDLLSNGRRDPFIKLKITLELSSHNDIEKVNDNMPKIRDVCQLYLRGLREEDIEGSAGVERLREELLLRVNKIVYPTTVKNILFSEIVAN